MSLVAQKITADALGDMLEMFEVQPWLKLSYVEMTELWGICESRLEQILLKKLLINFCVLDAVKENSACIGIAEKIKQWGLSFDTCWIVAVANKDEIDGSTAGLQKLKNKITPIDCWHSRMISSIPSAVDKIKTGDNIILFDDFIGSGGKMVRKKNWLVKLLGQNQVGNNQFFHVGFSGMRFGVKHVADLTGDAVYVKHTLLKGISESYPAAEALEMTDLMLRIESRLGESYKGKKISDYSLGFGKSEALYCGQNDNCPNNVFPILWWPTRKIGENAKTVLSRAG